MEIIRVPLLNANEDELVVVGVHVADGAEVRAGELLVSLESTKAANDIEAPVAGYVRALSVSEGERVEVGRVLCVITATLDEALPVLGDTGDARDGEVRATRRARELAEAHGVDLARLEVRGIVKERDVLRALEKDRARRPAAPRPAPLEGPSPIVILGAGGHARVLVDVIREGHRDLTIIAAVDDADDAPADVLGVPVIGGTDRLAELRAGGVDRAALGVGAVTHNATRAQLYAQLESLGFRVPTLIHPRASIEPSVRMGSGNQIFAGAVVGSNATLGDNVIVNSGVVVSHDCSIASHVHLTPGAILAGGVIVGENTVVGMGVTIYLGVKVGRDVVISNGVHVFHDVPDGSIVRAHAGPT